MSEPTPATSASSSPVPPTPKKKRWWLRILIAIPVLIILLVLLGPTLLSTAPARSLIVSKANGFLNGKVQMDDLSVGWLSGVKVRGVKLFDESNAQILELKSLDAPVSLIGAARGNIDLNTVTVDGLNGVLKIDKNGNNNFSRLVKDLQEKGKEIKEDTTKTGEGGETVLPDVKGNVVVKNSRFTIETEGQPPVYIDQLDANVKIASINQPIEDDATITLRVGDGKPGTIKVVGKADAVENNKLAIGTANVDQKLEISNVDLGSAMPFVPKEMISSLSGMTAGYFTLNVVDGKSANVQGKVQIQELNLAGAILKDGKPYAAKSVNLSVPRIAVAMPGGPENWQQFKDIQDSVLITIVPTTGEPAEISVNGTAASTSLETATTEQKLEIKNLDISQFAGFLDPKVIDTLKGVTAGLITLNLNNGKQGTMEGTLSVSGVEAAGEALKGDKFIARQILVTIPKTNIALPDGVAKWQTSRTSLGTEAAPLVAQIDQPQGQLFKATVFADVASQSLLDVIDDKKPGSAGKVKVTADGNVGQLFQSLPKLLHLADGVAVTKGQLKHNLDIILTTEDTKLSTNTNIKDVSGTRDGKAIALQPIDFSAGVISIGGIGKVPRLRDLKLNFKSAFATADFSGNTPAELKGNAKAQLEAMQKELGQIIDFGELKMAGAANVDIKSSGDLTQENGFSDATLDATLTDLKIEGLSGKQPISQPRIKSFVSVHAVRGSENFIDQIQNIKVTTQVGDAGAPTVDLLAGANVDMRGGNVKADFDLTKLLMDLPRVEHAFGALVPALKEQQIKLGGGSLGVTAKGAFDKLSGQATISAAQVTGRGLNISKAGANLLNNYNLDVGTVATATIGETTSAKISQLMVSDNTGLVSARLAGDQMSVNISKDKMVDARGGLEFGSNLVAVNNILQSLSATPGAPPAKKTELKSGDLKGNLMVSTGAGGSLDVKSDINLNHLIVATETGATPPQDIAIKAVANASGDFNTITAPSVTVQSRLVNVAITDVQANLASEVVYDMLRKANIKVDVPDLAGAYQLANAFVPPPAPTPAEIKGETKGSRGAKPPTPAEAEAEKPLPPLEFTGGKIAIEATVSHASPLTLNVSKMTVDGLAFKRGDITYKAQPINVKLIASLENQGDKLTQAQVKELDVRSGWANVSMPTQIIVKDPLGTPSAQGAIKADGTLDEAMRLLDALAAKKPGEAYPYSGAFVVTQTLGSEGQKITLNGDTQVTKFTVLSAKDSKPVFTEDRIDVKNNLWVDLPTKSANINSLSVDMPSSKALSVNVKGGLTDWETARNINNLQANLKYDLAKLLAIAKPMLSAEQQESFKDLKVEGIHDKTFLVGGSYPANVPMTQAIKSLKASGSVAVGLMDYSGLNLQSLEVPVTLKDGILRTVYADKPEGANMAPPAIANSGKLDLNGISVDLTQDPPRINIPENKVILENATINPLFSKTFLSKVINNPVFAAANQATGLVTFKAIKCENLPASELVKKKDKANTGVAEFAFDMTNLHIGVEGLSKALGDSFKSDAIKAEIKNARVSIANGIVTQNILFESGTFKMGFNGKVSLDDLKMLPLTVEIPAEWIVRRFTSDKNVLDLLPATIGLNMTGSVTSPMIAHLDQTAQRLFTEAAQAYAVKKLTGGDKKDGKSSGDPLKDALDGLLGGDKDKKDQKDQKKPSDQSTQKKEEKPADPIGDLIKGLSGDKDKDKKKKKK